MPDDYEQLDFSGMVCSVSDCIKSSGAEMSADLLVPLSEQWFIKNLQNSCENLHLRRSKRGDKKKGGFLIMKPVKIKCPYCGRPAILRPASYVHGDRAKEKYLYVCAGYPKCDAYVSVH